MDKFLADRIQLTVDNYRLVKEELRNDGDIINHFASLILIFERHLGQMVADVIWGPYRSIFAGECCHAV